MYSHLFISSVVWTVVGEGSAGQSVIAGCQCKGLKFVWCSKFHDVFNTDCCHYMGEYGIQVTRAYVMVVKSRMFRSSRHITQERQNLLDKSIGKWLVGRQRRREDNSKEGLREMCFERGKCMELAHSYDQQWCKGIRFAAVQKHAGVFVVTHFRGTLFSFICNEICFSLC